MQITKFEYTLQEDILSDIEFPWKRPGSRMTKAKKM